VAEHEQVRGLLLLLHPNPNLNPDLHPNPNPHINLGPGLP